MPQVGCAQVVHRLLGQAFNSLHAQRESCSAYILSQAGEGWSEIANLYDDGGFSGGSMDRPGLKALMADIGRGLIDVVVVYKVDRLTRSLADFARIVELFDQKAVSFVSITQAFNTTTSMGRLTLNVLLSFAQFEREVTGERIRDKIAASKQKGLWMGGRPPLGYDGVDLKLVIDPPEADTVRFIFRRYLELGSVHRLVDELAALGITSKRWLARKGEMTGGGVLGRGALYHMLCNPAYRGTIRHKEKIYPDAHPAIIDQTLWDAVQARLKSNGFEHPDSEKLAVPVLLRGLLFDAQGAPMAPVHTARRGRQYRYYATRVAQTGAAKRAVQRIGMGAIDDFVLSQTILRLRPDFLAVRDPAVRVRDGLVRVDLTEDAVRIVVRHDAVSSRLDALPGRARSGDDGMAFTLPITLKHRQGAVIIEAPQASKIAGRIDRALVRGVALAKSWADRLAAAQAPNLKALALSEGYCEHYAAKLLPLAWLAPDLVETILAGRQPAAMSLSGLTKQPLPVDWDEQRALFDRVGLAGGRQA